MANSVGQTAQITARISPQILQKLELYAKATRKTRSEVIEIAVERFLAVNEPVCISISFFEPNDRVSILVTQGDKTIFSRRDTQRGKGVPIAFRAEMYSACEDIDAGILGALLDGIARGVSLKTQIIDEGCAFQLQGFFFHFTGTPAGLARSDRLLRQAAQEVCDLPITSRKGLAAAWECPECRSKFNMVTGNLDSRGESHVWTWQCPNGHTPTELDPYSVLGLEK